MRENTEGQSCQMGQGGHMTLCKYVNNQIIQHRNAVLKNEKNQKIQDATASKS